MNNDKDMNMKNLSLAKIIVALTICNVYLLVCGVMGTVSEPLAESVDISVENDDNPQGMGTQDFITSDITQIPIIPDNTTSVTTAFGTPTLNMKPVKTTYKPSELMGQLELSNSSEKPDNNSDTNSTNSSDTSDTSEPNNSTHEPDTPSKPQDHNSNTSESTEDPEPTTSSTSDSESTSSTTSIPTRPPQTVTDNTAANEILTVNDGGDIVSGTALDIVSRIVMCEIGGTFAPEAIKAQAVASYTHVKYHNSHGSYPNVLLRDNVTESVRTLVESVIGQAVYYDGELIQAVYSASSAGCTASSKNVWGVEYPYLKSVYCELDASYDPNYGRKAIFSSSEIKSKIYNSTGIDLSGDPSDWFSINDRTEGKYVGNMTIGGYNTYVDSDGDTVKITGRVFRERIMGFDIRSSAFDIEYDADSDEFTITTYGYGHGVGLSENGANALAKYWVWDYKQILEFYYQGAYVK